MLFFLVATNFYGQSTQSLLWEPEVSLKISTQSRWAYSFGIANRTLFYGKEDGQTIRDQDQEHVELSHFTSYRTGSTTVASLGLRYRFIEVFDESSHDELRFIQQLVYAPENYLNLAHRFRMEERITERTTYRLRYAVSSGFLLSEDFGIGFGTEILYSIAKAVEPGLDQRVSMEISNTSFEDIELSLGLEYQYENYLINPEGELFIQSGISFDL